MEGELVCAVVMLYRDITQFASLSLFTQLYKKPRCNLGLVSGAWQCPTFAWANHTIIGDDSFHCPVRDGKEWDQVSIVTKQFLLLLLVDFDPSILIFQLLHIGLTDGFCQILFILFSSTCAINSQALFSILHKTSKIIESSLTGNQYQLA